MGTQRPVKIGPEGTPFGGEEPIEELGGPIAEHHGKKKEKEKNKKEKVEGKIKAGKFKKEETSEKEKTVQEISKEKEKPAKEIKKTKIGKAKIRSKKYQDVLKLIDRKRIYELSEALDLIKKTSFSKFPGQVEVHLRVLNKAGKPENLRGTLKYPHETGKKIKIVILDEKEIQKIQKTKKTDFDVALATPEMMPQVGKLAKILGPKGKMPNPKSGTVTANPEKTKKELEEGLSEYKTDTYGIIHQVIGKVSYDPKNLIENFQCLVAAVPREKIASIYLCATMGPSIKVATK